VAGISIGLVTGDKDRFVTLTDIEGMEDNYGDMDFKVAGTDQGITAIQLDMKVKGISLEIVNKALEQALSYITAHYLSNRKKGFDKKSLRGETYLGAAMTPALFTMFNALHTIANPITRWGAYLVAGLPGDLTVTALDDRALVALQGPAAASVMSRLGATGLSTMSFMSCAETEFGGFPCRIWRSGYTGEDGYEISCAAAAAEPLARLLLAEADVKPVGLGARDTLRLEAGLCLHGHDIDETTTPVEAALTWSIGKRRRTEGGFPGAGIILKQISDGVARRRVGIKPEGRAPAREGSRLIAAAGDLVGEITSGGFGPTVGGPIAMGYVESRCTAEGTALRATVRDREIDARVTRLPFVEQRYYRG